jgi:hypothetical protein
MAGKTRYFIVFYRGSYNQGESFGSHSVETGGGQYLNCDTIVELIRKKHKLDAVAVTGITELNKKDMDDWSYKEEGKSV